MRIKNVSIRKFLSVGEIEYSCENQGLILVEGDNKDSSTSNSNGAGKSTSFVDAITWCLYGATTKGQGADAVLPRTNGKASSGCRVSVDLEVGNHSVRVERYRKDSKYGNSVRLYIDGNDESKTTNSATDRLIADTLGIDRRGFLYTIVLGQGILYRFSHLTDAARKEVLESIIDTKVYDEARKAARKRLREVERRESELLGASRVASQAVAEAREALDGLRRKAGEEEERRREERERVLGEIEATVSLLSRIRPKLEELRSEVEARDVVVSKLSSKVQETEEEIRDLSHRLGVVEQRVSSAKESMERIRSLEAGVACPLCGATLTEQHMGEEINRRREELLDALKNRGDVVSQLTPMRSRLDTMRAELKRVVEERGKMSDLLSRSEREVVELESKETVLRNKLVSIDEVDNYTSLLRAAEQRLEEARTRSEALVQDLASLKRDRVPLEFWVEGFQKIRVMVMDEVLTYLNHRLNYYMDVLTDGDIGVKLIHNEKGKIDMVVTTAGRSYESMSGGEKDRLDFAVALALHDLSSEVSGMKCNVLVLDEPCCFTDDLGIERMMRLITEKVDRVETCFLVSQNPVFRGYVDRSWVVVKEGGVSRLEIG